MIKDFVVCCRGLTGRLFQGNRYEISRDSLEAAVEEVVVDDHATGMFQVNYAKLCDMEKARRDAQLLFKAGEDRWGTDEETFNRIFSTRDYYTMRTIYNEYVKVSVCTSRSRSVYVQLGQGQCMYNGWFKVSVCPTSGSRSAYVGVGQDKCISEYVKVSACIMSRSR